MDIDYEEILNESQSSQENSQQDDDDDDDFISDLGIRFTGYLTELQLLRLNQTEIKAKQETAERQLAERQSYKEQAEESKRAAEKATAAVNALLGERTTLAEQLADTGTKLKLLEGENAAMKERVRELVTTCEEMKRREAAAIARAATYDSTTTKIQQQIERTKRVLNSYQMNNQRLESEQKRLEVECKAAIEHWQIYNQAQLDQFEETPDYGEALKKAHKESARLAAELAVLKANCDASKKQECKGNCARVRELRISLDSERSVTKDLRGALEIAVESKRRLLAFNKMMFQKE